MWSQHGPQLAAELEGRIVLRLGAGWAVRRVCVGERGPAGPSAELSCFPLPLETVGEHTTRYCDLSVRKRFLK